MSCYALPGLYLNFWCVFMKFYPDCKLLCTSWAPFELLTYLYEILSRKWVAVHLLSSIWNANMPLWHSIQDVSCCASPRLIIGFFKKNEIISSWWVTVHLLGSVWIMDLLLWNYIQIVSCCAPSGLYLNHWHASMKSHPASELIWSFWFLFESLTHLYKISSRL